MNAERLPLFMDPATKRIGYVQMPSGKRHALYIKGGRYYCRPTGSFRSFPIARKVAAAGFIPMESESVN